MTKSSREDYRKRILYAVFKLVQMVEADDDQWAESLARGIHYDVREYFNQSRWKPTPVYDGIKALLPLDEPLTLLVYHHREGANGRQFVQGRIFKLNPTYSPYDGARLEIIPRSCRNPRIFDYRAGLTASLTVWRGHVPEGALERTPPLYHHETLPPIEYDQAL